MRTAQVVGDNPGALARWLDRSESALLIVASPSGAVVHVSRAFLRRGGHGEATGLRLDDLVVDRDGQPVQLIGSPPFGAVVTRMLVARADDTRWLCSSFELRDGDMLLVGTKVDSTIEDWARTETGLVADLSTLQRELIASNRELERAREELSTLLSTDPLTGVGSRRSFDERLKAELAAAARHGLPLSLVVCDIDHFKRVNDEHGHSAGDAVLRAFGAALKAGHRALDFAARPGGEEFSVLLPNTDLDGALVLAERLRARVAATVVEEIGRAVTASFGVAQWAPGESSEDWLERADQALYRAKGGGRNRVEGAGGD